MNLESCYRSLGIRNISSAPNAAIGTGTIELPCSARPFILHGFYFKGTVGAAIASRSGWLKFKFGGVAVVFSSEVPTTIGSDVVEFSWSRCGAYFTQIATPRNNCTLPLPLDLVMDSRFLVYFEWFEIGSADVFDSANFLVEDLEEIP